LEGYLAALEPAQRTKLLRTAAARGFDADVTSALMGVEAGTAFFTWLSNSPLTHKAGDLWRFHPVIRASLAALAKRDAPTVWQSAHGALLAFYRGRLSRWGDHLVLSDSAWGRDKLEELYHGLIVEEEADAVNAAMLSFLTGLRRSSSWSEAVIRCWEEAADQAPHRRAVAAWSEALRELWDALQDHTWAAVLAMVERWMEAALWQDPVRERLRSLHQRVGARLALPPEEAAEAPTEVEAMSSSVAEAPSTFDEAPAAGSEPEALKDSEALDTSASCALEPEAGDVDVEDAGEDLLEDQDVAPAEMAVRQCGQANERLASGEYEAALRAYDEAVALNPEYVAAYYNRGLTYVKLGALDLALADFNRVLELDRDHVQAYRQRAQLHARRGNLERALADYDAALGRRPTEAGLYHDRANIYYRLHLYDRAIENYDEAIDLDPTYIEAYLNRGLAHIAQGDAVEALEDYNRALRHDPERAIAYHYRGQAYARLERYSEALKDYERAVDLNPRYAAAYNSRGLIYVRLEAYPEAIEAYQRAMAIRPEWATPFYNAACAAALNEDAERACGWLGRAISLREAYRAMALRDPDFSAIRGHPQFQSLMDEA
jgi:tetratricopeptide (TPR) repeat protein